ncbi:MAG: OmpA family protein [Candidatus Eisenbacteria bacterium]
MKRMVCMVVAGALVLGAAGCASMNNKEKGALIGGTAGAVVGGIIGKQAGNTAVGAIAGAAVGGTAGVIIGDYMDDQAEELAKVEGADVKRVGEGIQLTFDSGILFDVNKSDLKGQAKLNLDKVATVLRDYPDTDLLIAGHTDSDGAEDYNMTLSQHRADSVKTYLVGAGVDPRRLETVGFGETQPVADNSTSAGKAQNRRVEVAIMATEELQARAQTEAGEG